MIASRRPGWGLLLVGLLAVGSAGWAAPPWQTLVPQPVKKLECDPNADYTLTESNGPWTIVAATFRAKAPGKNRHDPSYETEKLACAKEAKDQAQELVVELRKRYKLAAYMHDRTFDFSQRQPGLGYDRYGRQKRMIALNEAEKVNEIAVLVGDFPSVGDPLCQATLKQVKALRPDSLDVQHGKGTCLLTYGVQAGAFKHGSDNQRDQQPLAKAFVSFNPLLSPDAVQTKGVDKLVADMNKEVDYSLLKCKGRYTVQVATFTGEVTIDQNKIEKLKNNKDLASQSKLAEAAEKAHRVTTALREKGYEAYEFHDRNSSIVTVGSFDSVGLPRADGKIEINPLAFKIIETFKAKDPTAKFGQPGLSPTGVLQPEKVTNVSMDIQPMMVEVPRRSISADYRE